MPGPGFAEDRVWSWARCCPGAVMLLFLGCPCPLGFPGAPGTAALPGEPPGPIPAEPPPAWAADRSGDTGGNCNAWLQITNVFCCGTLIKLLFPAGALWCCEWSRAQPAHRPPLAIQMQISFVLIPHNCSASRLGLPEAPRKSCLLRLQFRLYIICDNYSYKV